jgi:glycosyltransferase involved in cell wall biosynthesis
MNGVSIIIPTYDNVEYLDETLGSIYSSTQGVEHEILVGIDKCEKTLNHILENSYPKEVKFYYFLNNKGPYIIKNTLSKLSKYNKILFFDSDDLMLEPMVKRCLQSLERYHFFKPRLTNFEIIDSKMIEKKNRREWGEGVFGIRKEIFLKYNGFEPWPVAADSDFMKRLYKNNVPFEMSNEVLMLRRLHSKGLTSNPKTGLRSKLRSKYASLMRSKTDFSPLKIMVTLPYIDLTTFIENNDQPKKIIIDINDVIREIKEEKNESNKIDNKKINNQDLLTSIFNKKPTEILPINENKLPKQKIVSDNPLFNILNKKTNITNNEKILEKRKEIEIVKQKTNRQIYKEMHPSKPNRRLDLPKLRL